LKHFEDQVKQSVSSYSKLVIGIGEKGDGKDKDGNSTIEIDFDKLSDEAKKELMKLLESSI
jgi:hypothetical protein